MAGRGRTSFQKRQKEQLRLERRPQKAARKQERKLNKDSGVEETDEAVVGLESDAEVDVDGDVDLVPGAGSDASEN